MDATTTWPRLLALGLAARLLTAAQVAALGVGTRGWYTWDGAWYLRIATAGYAAARDGATGQPAEGFLPALPLLIRGGMALGLPAGLAGILAVNAAFPIGLACFGRAARVAAGDATAWRACLVLCAFPHSFFFSLPYQESIGFALVSAAALAWVARRPAWSAAAIAPAGAARLSAAAFPAAILAEWAWSLAGRRPARHVALLVAPAAAIGVGAFFWWLGGPGVHLRAHAAWGRAAPSPLNALRVLARPSPAGYPGEPAFYWYSFALAWAVVLAGLLTLRRLGPFWGVLALFPALQALSTGTLMSLPRLSLASFPACLGVASMLRGRPLVAALAASMAAQSAFVAIHFRTMLFVP